MYTGLKRPFGFQNVEAPSIYENMKLLKFSALLIDRLFSPRK
jgi:hypothetical protein